MSELPQGEPRFFQREIVRGALTGCAIQFFVGGAFTALAVFAAAGPGSESLFEPFLIGGWTAAALILLYVGLRLRKRGARERARGVALSVGVGFLVGLTLAAGLYLFLMILCGQSTY